MVVAMTILVLILIGTISGLVAASVPRRAAAQRVDLAIAELGTRPPTPGVPGRPSLDRALDDLERVVAAERQRRQEGRARAGAVRASPPRVERAGGAARERHAAVRRARGRRGHLRAAAARER